MVLYKIHKISKGEDLFTKIPQKESKILNPRFTSFKLQNKDKYIICKAHDNSIESIFSPEDNAIYDDIDIEVFITRYKFLYSIVKLSGRGLMSIRGLDKYIDNEILTYIKNHLKNNYNFNIDFESFEFNNNHFSKHFWGNNITAKLGYNSSNRMYIKISSTNFNKLMEKYPDLENYYSNGIIKSIKGANSDLEYIEENKRYLGMFKFNRSGVFRCDLPNVIIFNDFIIKLIDKGFFGSF